MPALRRAGEQTAVCGGNVCHHVFSIGKQLIGTYKDVLIEVEKFISDADCIVRVRRSGLAACRRNVSFKLSLKQQYQCIRTFALGHDLMIPLHIIRAIVICAVNTCLMIHPTAPLRFVIDNEKIDYIYYTSILCRVKVRL